MGVLLLLFHLAWMRDAQLLFAIFEWQSVPSWDRFTDLVWHSARSLPFLEMLARGEPGTAVIDYLEQQRLRLVVSPWH